MTRTELRNKLMLGKTLDSLLRFTPGQDCFIYKAEEFAPGDDVLYIPDIALNDIPIDKDLSADIEGIFDVLGYCYTGNHFIDYCDGDVERAERLFWYCDWQHPTSALDEVDDF